jgi:hypothetical protein
VFAKGTGSVVGEWNLLVVHSVHFCVPCGVDFNQAGLAELA